MTGYRWWRQMSDGPVGEWVFLGTVALVTLGGSYLSGRHSIDPTGPLGWALLVAALLALAFRRRYPRIALLVTLGAAAAYYMLGNPPGVEPLPFVVALYHAVTAGRRISAIVAATACVLVIQGAELLSDAPLETDDLFPVVGWLVAIIVFGEFSRSRRAYLRAVEARAVEAERTAEAEARRRVAEERLRIARELHDSVGHHITVMRIHASAAIMRRATHPDLAYEALGTISTVSQEALRDLRGTLAVLRDPGDDGARQPAPTLAALPDLARRTQAAGPVVRTTVDGPVRPLPSGIEVAAYRIVQEALTNVTRHADAERVDVRLRYEPDQLVVQIDDDGRASTVRPAPPAASSGGTGLVGMRERAAAVGGDLLAGPRPEGGFRVRALFPVKEVG
ncbi:sensor histidine kinase [Asanoa sp. WMMD1127]|uniref:sensor histidine kinase n=1 Tax=Asanoa sp. WMMD1127 TaxID=3016107 RepID=UPI00241798E8|nr:sensor histidine kinase [Asanoa sp. WMMD1127]MDG4820782.1 sensor histidine kinase [Asanoa sp. WMMD1127]